MLNAEIIFEPLNGIGSRIESKTSSAKGFPVYLPGSAEYSFYEFDNNFILLTDTYLYNYEQTGAQSYAFQHGYGTPVILAGDSRILLYNHNSTEYSIFNRGSRINYGETEQKIIGAFIGEGDMSGIVTASKRYSNELYVYDRNGAQRFIRRFIDENVSGVDFSGDGSYVYISTVKAINGSNHSMLQKFSLKNEENAVWSYSLPFNSWTLKVKANGPFINLIGDNSFVTLESETGDLVGSYEYDGGIKSAVFGDDFHVLVVHDNVSNDNILITLDQESSVISTKIMSANLKQVEIFENMVYTLEGGFIRYYDKNLKELGEHRLAEEYDGFIVIGNSAFLLGFDVVEKIELS